MVPSHSCLRRLKPSDQVLALTNKHVACPVTNTDYDLVLVSLQPSSGLSILFASVCDRVIHEGDAPADLCSTRPHAAQPVGGQTGQADRACPPAAADAMPQSGRCLSATFLSELPKHHGGRAARSLACPLPKAQPARRSACGPGSTVKRVRSPCPVSVVQAAQAPRGQGIGRGREEAGAGRREGRHAQPMAPRKYGRVAHHFPARPARLSLLWISRDDRGRRRLRLRLRRRCAARLPQPRGTTPVAETGLPAGCGMRGSGVLCVGRIACRLVLLLLPLLLLQVAQGSATASGRNW